MKPNTRFRVDEKKIVHEIIDGEAVLVNLDTGSYYSTDKIGARIWDHVASGMAVGHIIQTIADRCSTNPLDIEGEVTNFLIQLNVEGLIASDNVEGINGGDALGANSDMDSATSDHDKLHFEEPILHKYTDMEDLLLLDPIHDVDETGWPKPHQDDT